LKKIFKSYSEEETISLGFEIGKMCIGGENICLNGNLGAGKTCLTRGIAKGLDVLKEYPVTSPTFTLVNEYPGRLLLIHIDCYRLSDPGELLELGLLERDKEDYVIVIEWPKKLKQHLSDNFIDIFIEVKDEIRYLEFVSCNLHLQSFMKIL